MVRFILMVVSVLLPAAPTPVHRGDGARRTSPDKPVYTEWFVDMSKPGIKVTKLEKLGLRMDSCCEITFDDVELDEKDMFGREGNGFNRVKEEFDHERFW